MTFGWPHRPADTRRGIHGHVEVSLLIGFAIVMAGVSLAVLADTADNAANTAGCMLSEVLLYKTGTGKAYFAATLYNMGSSTITSADVVLFDDAGSQHELHNGTLAIGPGQAREDAGSFRAVIVPGDRYMVGASASSAAGLAECSVVHRAG